MVNFIFAFLMIGWLVISNGLNSLASLSMANGPLFQRLAMVNLTLLLFNLIPAFPMDGGRVLRAILAMRMEYTQATHTAATIGQGFALVFGLIGLLTNPFLIFVALFVWIGASHEFNSVKLKEAITGIPIV